MAAAFGLRAAWLATHVAVIENDGAEYVRIAQNLLASGSYVGTMGGAELIFPPLYPLLIAGLSFLLPSTELAARMVSLLAGTATVIAVFLIARRLYGERLAFVVAGLMAVHPVLVTLSGTTFSEPLYIALLMWAVYWVIRGMQEPGLPAFLIGGVFCGLAYLTRPEAMGIAFLLAFLAMGSALLLKRPFVPALRNSILLLVACVAVAFPYIYFLWSQTGQVRFEGKSEINFIIAHRMLAGMNSNEASWGITPDLKEVGPLLDPNPHIRHVATATAAAGDTRLLMIHDIPHAVNANAQRWLKSVFSIYFALPLFFVLVGFSLIRRSLEGRVLLPELALLVLLLFLMLPMFITTQPQTRFLFPLLPFLLLIGTRGAFWMATDLRRCVQLHAGARLANACAWMVVLGSGLLILALAQSALTSVRRGVTWRIAIPEFRESSSSNLPLKTAGQWLEQHYPGPKRVMDTGTVVSYYSAGTWVPLPYASPETVLKYIAAKHPDFVVVNGFSYAMSFPWGQPWLSEGISDRRVHLVYRAGDDNLSQRILVYHWQADAAPESTPAARSSSQPYR